MDANETRYHLLLGLDDWARCTDEAGQALSLHWHASPLERNTSGLEWDGVRRELRLQPRLFQFSTSPFERQPSLERRRGAGRDRYGNWYWIGEDSAEIRVLSAGSGASSHFWSAGDGVNCQTPGRSGEFTPKDPPAPMAPLPLSGLAVTVDHYLVAGVLQPKGVLIFDLHAGGSPRQLLWPDESTFVPFDMAPRPGGGVWILDRVNARYWGLDREFNVIRLEPASETVTLDDFQPIDAPGRQTARRPFPEPIELGAASPLVGLDPIAIEAMPDGTVLILDNTPGQAYSPIFRYRLGEPLGEPVSTETVRSVVEESEQGRFHLRGYDFAFLPGPEAASPALLGRVYVTAMDGNQTYAFELFERHGQLALQAMAEYYPMRLFGGKALVAGEGLPYYDFGETWIPLVQQKRPRYEPTATLFTPLEDAFDGREPDCVWHRLLIDGCIPPDTGVQVWSRAANELHQLDRSEWLDEPPLYRRGDGSELPYARRPTAGESGTWEVLFQRARGRYLQLKIQLNGDGRSTPHLRALRAYYPRFSYLTHYLPGVYREDPESASFLDRFLANIEGFYTALEDKIAAVQMLLDVRSAPAEVLDWLADWFGLALDPVWDEQRRRLFIEHAMDFFQYRGTIHGLLMALHLALDPCADEAIFEPPTFESVRAGRRTGDPASSRPARRRATAIRIIEKYRMRRTPPVVLGDPTLGGELPVVLRQSRWTLNQGSADLHRRYGEFLGAPGEPYPLQPPSDEVRAGWQQFSRNTLGFVPSATGDDLPRWRDYLARRYPTIGALNAAYALPNPQAYAGFAAVGLPAQLPDNAEALKDWFQFERVVLAMHRTAHQFSVLLPAPAQVSQDEQQRRIDLALRIARLEQPAHTTFDVKFFWAMFRVGEARLGEDTLVDLGSRAPWFTPPFVVGQGYVLEGYLAPGHPQSVGDRPVLGRDRLNN